MKWKNKLIEDFLAHRYDDSIWNNRLSKIITENRASIHLAIFNEPFLSMIFDQTKMMESRFSINQVVPFRRVVKGDLVIMKKSGGSVEGSFIAGEVQYFSNLSEERISKLNESLGNKIGWHIDPEFLSNKRGANFLSLVEIREVHRCKSFDTSKKDRTGWSIVKLGLQHTLFDQNE